MPSLVKRDDYYDSAWYSWGRWILLAIVIIIVVGCILSWALGSFKKRHRTQQPLAEATHHEDTSAIPLPMYEPAAPPYTPSPYAPPFPAESAAPQYPSDSKRRMNNEDFYGPPEGPPPPVDNRWDHQPGPSGYYPPPNGPPPRAYTQN